MTPWVRRRSFQTRLSALVAVAVGVAVALAAVASYFAVSHQLYKQVTTNLTNVISSLEQQPSINANLNLIESHGVSAEAFLASGKTVPIEAGRGQTMTLVFGFHPSKAQLALSRESGHPIVFTTASSKDGGYRLAITPLGVVSSPFGFSRPQPGILVVAESLGPVEHTLANLRLILFLVALGGILVAIGLGRFVAKTTIRPVERLTAAAEHVAATQHLDARINEDSGDELGRLAHAFNEMLVALGASRQQQAQLVSDAGHELRTPLTSLRTNVELLVRARDLPDDDRRELLSDVTAQLEELTTLIGDLVDMARQDEQQAEPTEVRLDHIVEHAIQRAQRRAPSLHFELALTAGSVRAQPAMLERAVLNVLDNAAKWSPPGGAGEVALTRGERWYLDIRDHGPGIAPEDLPKVFDRFYRAPTARSMPGSGLGLAIVNQVVTSHGGTVTAVLPPDGGTLIRIELPIVAEQEPPAAVIGPPSEVTTESDSAVGDAPWAYSAGWEGDDEVSPWAPVGARPHDGDTPSG
jgi:two-component system sensor histidine kinase MprB